MIYEYNWTRFWVSSDVELNEYVYLPDPETPWGDKQIVTYEVISQIPCLILLGDPGAGKSRAIKQIANNLIQNEELCVFKDFREYSDFRSFIDDIEADSNFQIWQENSDTILNLFLDSLDEGRLEMRRLDHDLTRFLSRLSLGRLKLRITSRIAELPIDFRDKLNNLWVKEQDDNFVQSYRLLQLREKDIFQAAQQREDILDANHFMDSVREVGIQAIAAHPITLDMLFLIYENQNGKLPKDRSRVYELGCLELVSEVSDTRRDDGYKGNYDITERLNVARQLAYLSIICNRARITTANVGDIDTLTAHDSYLESQNYSHDLLEETLYTGLFKSIKSDTFIWLHRSIGEYLAADYIRKNDLSLKQIKSLLINSHDPENKTAPLLHETIAWLVTLQSDVLDWIMTIEPIILVNSETSPLSNEQKSRIVASFLDLKADGKLSPQELHWNRYKNLKYPNLGIQLRSYLQDKNMKHQVRDLAMDFAIHCEVDDIDDVFINIALDKEDHLDLRIGALRVLSGRDNIKNVTKLRSLVFEAKKYKADVDLSARAVEILWHEHLNSEELFGYLRLPGRNEFVIGSTYDSLLRNKIIDYLDVTDLPVALDWIAQNCTALHHEFSFSGEDFVMGIMRLAWKYLDHELVKYAFARAAWTRLKYFNPVIQDRDRFSYRLEGKDRTERNYALELSENDELRHQLLEAMLNQLTTDDLKNEKILFRLLGFGSAHLRFAFIADIPFLLNKSRIEKLSEMRKAYIYLIIRLLPNESQIVYRTISEVSHFAIGFSAIYEECVSGQNFELANQFRGRFYYGLKSRKALQGRRVIEKRENDLQEMDEMGDESEKYQADVEIPKLLKLSEQDSWNWWRLWLSLVANEYGEPRYYDWDIRNGHGWKIIASDTDVVGKIIQTGIIFIKEQNPYIGNIEEAVPLMDRYPALAAYQLLILLTRFNRLHLLSSADWKVWAGVVMLNIFSKGDEIVELDRILVETAFEYVEDELIVILDEWLNVNDEIHEFPNLIKRYELANASKVDSLLLGYLKQVSPETSKFKQLLQYLLVRDTMVAENALKIAKEHINTIEDTNILKNLIKILIDYTPNAKWWDEVWGLITSDIAFAKEVFKIISDWHESPFLSNLSEYQLLNLYQLVVKVYPYSEDKEFHGGTVPDWYVKQRWRDNILKELSNRGTSTSLSIVADLHNQEPDIPHLDYILQLARARFREMSWQAPEPQYVLQLTQDRRYRYIRNSDQLFELIIDMLQEIEREYRGNAAKKRAVWDKISDRVFRPAEEEALSNAIASWLREKLTKVIINREPEVGFVPQSRERTDIQVETFNEDGDSLIVIIEVKGCWYKNIYHSMQTQLVDQYIDRHNHCNHGIYLVGYFSSSKWDATDTRCKKCGGRNKVKLEKNLKQTSQQLKSSKSIVIQSFVFDASF